MAFETGDWRRGLTEQRHSFFSTKKTEKRARDLFDPIIQPLLPSLLFELIDEPIPHRLLSLRRSCPASGEKSVGTHPTWAA